jgi:hypothetical protein
MVRLFTLLCLGMLLGPVEAEAKPKKKTEEPMGPRVMAPWGRMGKRFPGIVVARYGRFVEVKFDDGYSGWCAGDLTNPPIEPLPQPKDPNPWKAGDKVQARWSLKGFLRAVVIDTYGSLTLVQFESDDRAWIRAAEVKAR